MTDHPITPPPELVEQWVSLAYTVTERGSEILAEVATLAARWGADQELKECVKWTRSKVTTFSADAHLEAQRHSDELRAARRPQPKPPSLNEVALQMLGTIERDAHYLPEITDTIRRALEALPE
jgi:hypothetical protein